MTTETIWRGKTTEEMYQEIALAHKALEIALEYFCQYNQLPHSDQWGSVDFWINKAEERLGLKLLPCPFCGTPAKKFVYTDMDIMYTWNAVKCSDSLCASRTTGWTTEIKAIAAWNKRIGENK